jgi:hypothetical protein
MLLVHPLRMALSSHPEGYINHLHVGRRGTSQLRLVEWYLDILVKHTTEIPPPSRSPSPTDLVEGVLLR